MNVKDYLNQPLTIRQSHLCLDDQCLERGGSSQHHKGVLAEHLGSNIYGRPADLCHACHNPKCSNPQHLYWGTRSENMLDAKENGGNTPWENIVAKYGESVARNMLRENAKRQWKGNTSRPKMKWISNGIQTTKIKESDTIPEGWNQGRK